VCVRVFTGPFPSFLTLDKVCHDVGQVKELPAILLLYYDEPNHILRKSYQGEVTIQSSLLNGQLKRKLKDFIDQRLQQMMKGSLKEPEIQYQHNLSRMSRSLSEDDMVQKRRSQDIGHETINIPSTVPESCEQVLCTLLLAQHLTLIKRFILRMIQTATLDQVPLNRDLNQAKILMMT
jgi:hypothetical protein